MNNVGVIDTFLNTFTTYIDSGFGLIKGEVGYLSSTLIVIDITLAGLFWAWGADEDILQRLVKKTLYIGFFAFIINNFNNLSAIVFNSFAGLGLKAGGSSISTADFLRPGKLAQVGLAGFGDKFPWQLSGGMMQRANLCRALIHEPDLLLLDEPFGALDQFTREELWQIMQELWMTKKTTVLLVTHDLREAAFLGSRICVMSARPGRILEDQPVRFARPRSIEMTYQPDFVALNQHLRGLIVEARGGGGIVQAGGH